MRCAVLARPDDPVRGPVRRPTLCADACVQFGTRSDRRRPDSPAVHHHRSVRRTTCGRAGQHGPDERRDTSASVESFTQSSLPRAPIDKRAPAFNAHRRTSRPRMACSEQPRHSWARNLCQSSAPLRLRPQSWPSSSCPRVSASSRATPDRCPRRIRRPSMRHISDTPRVRGPIAARNSPADRDHRNLTQVTQIARDALVVQGKANRPSPRSSLRVVPAVWQKCRHTARSSSPGPDDPTGSQLLRVPGVNSTGMCFSKTH